MKLMDVNSMKMLESAADAGGYSFEKMMDKAGTNLAHIVHDRFFSIERNKVIGFVGGGNNGGDTLVALTELLKLGWQCAAIQIKTDNQPEQLLAAFVKAGGELFKFDGDPLKKLQGEIENSDVVLDGVIGTGFSLPARDSFTKFMQWVGMVLKDQIIVAVDCPSGVDSTTGKVASNVLKADLTVCMEAVKEGLVRLPAFEYCGDMVTVELGIPQKVLKSFISNDFVIDEQYVREHLPKRDVNSHKGTFGHLIVCGGCVNYTGAPILAGLSAYRSGTGLVESAIPERIYESAAASHLESIWLLLADEDGVIAETAAPTLVEHLRKANCLLLGPGMGREETTEKFVHRIFFEEGAADHSSKMGFLVEQKKNDNAAKFTMPPLVIDADGLWLINKEPDWYKKIQTPMIITPHPGEMSMLTGLPVDEIQDNRIEIARQYASQWQKIVVLKGALSVVASPEGYTAVMPFADAVLAKAGTGDVLAGIISGLTAQGLGLFDAAVCGVWIHARAASLYLEYQGNGISLLASDLIDLLADVFSEL